jgi:hypothetical protein
MYFKKKMSFYIFYSVFHRFRQAKFAYGDSILSWSQFLPLRQPPLKTTLTIKVVKIVAETDCSLEADVCSLLWHITYD